MSTPQTGDAAPFAEVTGEVLPDSLAPAASSPAPSLGGGMSLSSEGIPEGYTGWRRQMIWLDVLCCGTDPANLPWRTLIQHGSAVVVASEPARMPGEGS